MGRIDFYKFRSTQNYSKNVLDEFKFVASKRELSDIINFLTNCNDLLNIDRTCYLFGYGSQPKTIYRNLKEDENTDYTVVWHGYNGPKKFKIISFITASTSGLIRINEMKCISPIFSTISHLSMAGIFSCSKIFAEEFEKSFLNDRIYSFVLPENYIKGDKSFFYFIADGDSYDEKLNGFLCKASLGIECPRSFFEMANFTNKKW